MTDLPSTSHEMETEEGASTSKRQKMSEEEEKSKYNAAEKLKQLSLLIDVAEALTLMMYPKWTSADNVNIGNSHNVSGVLATLFNYYRRSANPNNQTEAAKKEIREKFEKFQAKMSGGPETIVQISQNPIISGIFKEMNYMIATPIMNMLTCFRLQYSEARIGCHIKNTKENKNTAGNRMKDFGLSGVHAVGLIGITYPPERASGLLKCMGPLTLAIKLITNKKYQTKVKEAFVESIKHIDGSEDLAEFFSKATIAEAKTVLPIFGNLITIILDRSHRKFMPPILSIVKLRRLNKKVFDKLDFSGKGAFYVYNEISNYSYTVNTEKNLATNIRQTLFHGIFGTFLEDFGVLSGITNCHDWYTRSHLAGCFYKKSEPEHTVMELIKFTHISKMVSANLTKYGAGAIPQMTSRPVFSGARTRTFTDDYLQLLKTGKTISVYGSNPHSIRYELEKKIEKLRSIMKENTEIGTTAWYKQIRINEEGDLEYDELVETRFVETGVYYFGIDS